MVLDFKKDNMGCSLESGALKVQTDSEDRPVWATFHVRKAREPECIEAAILIGQLVSRWYMTLALVTLDIACWPKIEFWRHANEHMCYFCCIGTVRFIGCPEEIMGPAAHDALMLQFSCATLVMEKCTGIDMDALTRNMRKIRLVVCKHCEFVPFRPANIAIQRVVVYGNRTNLSLHQAADVKFLA